MKIAPGIDLTYCTNIHPGRGWADVRRNLERVAPRLKAALSRGAPFGLGLRLSAIEARELLAGRALDDFRAFLDREGLYVAVINGFPYGPFHGEPVKTGVYAPDWQDEARLEYTLDLVKILARLLPPGMDGGISTSPLSYKEWMRDAEPGDWKLIGHQIRLAGQAMMDVRERTGAVIHLDVEPEPDCSLETTTEAIEFFDRFLPDAAIREHVGICFDCCHVAVEFEDPVAAIAQYRDAGIRIGRVQLSSAIDAELPGGAGSAAAAERLRPFADSTYLHQVIETGASWRRKYDDLDVALASAPDHHPCRWRVHFHVPLFTREYDGLDSTQDVVRAVLAEARRRPFTTHLEIETYTWDVLPAPMKLDVAESIEREYRWVLREWGA